MSARAGSASLMAPIGCPSTRTMRNPV
jgi:hypothetical protein